MPPKTKDIEKYQNQLEIKYAVLDDIRTQISPTLTSGNTRKVIRLKNQLQEKLDESFTLITSLAELKLCEGHETSDVMDWKKTAETTLQTYDDLMDDIDEYITGERIKEEQTTKNREDQWLEERRHKQKLEDEEFFKRQKIFELELEEKRMKLQSEIPQKAKLPKLEITKFDGTITDWVRFWEQFGEEIDKCKQYAAITKFSYLRELLSTQPKAEIAGLPFTEDGYDKAKNILQQKYGNVSEIVHAHGQQISNLPTINSTSNTNLIHQFYRTLNISINSLKTLKKLDTAEILVRQTLDKLGPVKADLIRADADWQKWDFTKLLDELRGYTIRNPDDQNKREKQNNRQHQHHPIHNKVKGFHTSNKDEKRVSCVYCEGDNHRSSDCQKVTTIKERKEILRKKRLCYNCTGGNHSVSSCRSRSCGKCNQRHHTSICHLQDERMSFQHQRPSLPHTTPPTSLYMVEDAPETIHPTLVAMAKGQKFRVLLDTGAGNSFISSTFVNHINEKPLYWESKALETLTATVSKKLPVYNVEIQSTNGKFSIMFKANKLDRPVLTTLCNPNITQLKKKYPHLAGLHFDNEDTKKDHPIHIILGAGEIAKIKAGGFIQGKSDEPIAENTLFGWTLMGNGSTTSNLACLANTSQEDYQSLCSLDVLGLEDTREGDQSLIHQEFKEQLQRMDDGTYLTHLPWRENHPFLPENKAGSIARLKNQLRRLKKTPAVLQEYDNIIREQLANKILEVAPETPTGRRIFYMPHRAVIRSTAETTKMRIVYDASARENNNAPSLNDCLHTGPALQPLLQDVLIRNRLKPIALLGDVKQAFLQIGIHEDDRDALRLHWVKDLVNMEIITLRFTRLPFGCTPSPFVLNATLGEHLETYHGGNEVSDIVQEIKDSLFVDDLITGGVNEEEVQLIKKTAIDVFAEGGFILHKWHSNSSNLEQPTTQHSDDLDTTFAKEHLNTTIRETKILGVAWDKLDDSIGVNFIACKQQPENTKRGILRGLASIYDPLGIASPLLIFAKQLYRNICEMKIPWDKELPELLWGDWTTWSQSLPDMMMVPRSLTKPNQTIHEIELHGFGDASKEGCCSAIYAVVKHSEGTTTRLLTAKSRISKKETSIPRLELIAGHMVANSLGNVRTILHRYPVASTYAWLDSTVALYWVLNDKKEWKQFVSNRVAKINQKKDITWRHCPTKDNPADIGSRGTTLTPLWFDGPTWLGNKSNWPENIVQPSQTTVDEERKLVKQINLTTVITEDRLVPLLEKHTLTKVLRITTWIRRFITNCRSTTVRKTGEISSEEIESANIFLIQRAQQTVKQNEKYDEIRTRLQLTENAQGILVCMGRIKGEHPIYLPNDNQFTKLVIQDAHHKTKHGLVTLTMAKIREHYWVERLRRLVKTVIHQCHLCQRYHCKPLIQTGTTKMPTYRTTPTRAFETTGVDFAGPFEYKIGKGEYGKAYLTLFTCATSRAVYLDLLENMEAETFKRCLKEFFARRGNPSLMVSDNAKTFQNTAKWLDNIQQNAGINTWFAQQQTRWKFNLSRSPWWGGFFERMVGMAKSIIYKTLGRSRLPFLLLKEVTLEVEVILNNRPLGYLEDDIELPMLTPNMLIHGTNASLPQKFIDDDPDYNQPEPPRLYKHIQRCKDHLWKRWHSEYLLALRERHKCSDGSKIKLNIGDVVQLKGEQKNRGEWRIGVITKLVKVNDVILGAKVQTGNTTLERPVQMIYPLELQRQNTPVNKTQPDDDHTKKQDKESRGRLAKHKAIQGIRNITADLNKDDRIF